MQIKRIQNQVLELPLNTGVYKFFDKKGEILYIGKAHNLKIRVASYFSQDHHDRPRIISMIPLIYNIETIITDNDIEALVLESALIKKHKPKFNSLSKDDKSYAYLYIDTKKDYPTVKIVRQINKEMEKEGKIFGPYPSGKIIKKVFTYLRKIFPFCTSKDPTKPCFHMHIGLCPGPIPTKEYKKNIHSLVKFLKGKSTQIFSKLTTEMKQYSKNQEFEKAAILRDKINDLKYITTQIDLDNDSTEEEYIQNKADQSKLSNLNLSKELGITELTRIECYDISNLQGTNAYGSMTVAINGQIKPSEYRIFKIKSQEKPNDPLMLKEVLSRRIKYLLRTEVDSSFSQRPSLILIDGGPTQLSQIVNEIPNDIYVLGISKGKHLKRKGMKKSDEFWNYIEGKAERVKLKNTQLLKLLRDEAHRFAISYHRKKRLKTQKVSILDSISGVGPKTKKILKQKFSSIAEIKKTNIDTLVNIVGNRKTATNILTVIKNYNSDTK